MAGNRLTTAERDLTLICVLFIGLRLEYHCRKKDNVMTKVAILPEPSVEGSTVYRAVAGARQAVAKTVGGALDALAAQLPPEESGTLVVVQNHRPDQFFTAQQQQRLEELMGRWRVARDAGKSLSLSEEAELNALVDAEVQASGERAAAALAGLEK
jgi:hypothetical protein